MDNIAPFFTATAIVIGGCNGHAESSGGLVEVDLSASKEIGAPGQLGTVTPEHLFAAGYDAGFRIALDFVGRQRHKDASRAKIICAVAIGPRAVGGFGLAVKRRIEDGALPHSDFLALAVEAHGKRPR